MEQQPANGVYQSNLDDERLAFMATGYADTITLAALMTLELSRTDVVLDIGSGSSCGLGDAIKRLGATYIALDKNPSSVQQHHQHGHLTVEASATNLPMKSESITLFNARFSLSWLGKAGREKAWEQMLEVGSPQMRGVVTEYDWSVADGAPAYRAVVDELRQQLTELGFEPDYGALVESDTRRLLTEHGVVDEFSLQSYRQPIPCQTPDEALAVVAMTVQSLTSGLRLLGRANQADSLDLRLSELKAAPEEHIFIKLPDIVSVRFERRLQADHILPVLNDGGFLAPVLRISPDRAPHRLRQTARIMLSAIYKRAGYITDSDLGTADLLEATDPQSVFDRSDVFAITNIQGRAESVVRLVYPDDSGLSSLPTGHKLINLNEQTTLPADAEHHEIGEITSFVSVARNGLTTLRSIVALMEVAHQARLKYVLFGAVAGAPDIHFKQLFGPTIRPVKVGQNLASVAVSGPGYTASGIDLRVSYLKTSDFLDDMVAYYQNSQNKYEDHIVELCKMLSARRAAEIL